MSLALALKRFLKKSYRSIMGWTYRSNVLLGFRNDRYVYRLITMDNGFFPGKLADEDIQEYIEGQLVSDFQSNRLTARGFYILIRNIELRSSYQLHCKLSRVLYRARFVSPKLKIYDELNNALLVKLVANPEFDDLDRFKEFVVSNKDSSWSFSCLYKIINTLYLEKHWRVLRILAWACIECNPNNLQVNKKYLISLARLGQGTIMDYLNDQLFLSQAFSDQLEIFEEFNFEGIGLASLSGFGGDQGSLYAKVFQAIYGKPIGDLESSISGREALSYLEFTQFIELYYREKFLFIGKQRDLLEHIEGRLLLPHPSLMPVFDLIKQFQGRCGDDEWDGFIYCLHESLDKVVRGKVFSRDFLLAIGYLQKEALRQEELHILDASVEGHSSRGTLLVVNSKVSNSYFSRLNHKYHFEEVLEYGTTRQADIDFEPSKIVSMSMLMPSPGAPLDMKAYGICNQLSLDYFDEFSRLSGFEGWQKKFITEVFALALEDLFYGHVKRLVTLVEYVSTSGFGRIVIPYRLHEFSFACSVAHALRVALGVECVLERDYGIFDRGRYFSFAAGIDAPSYSLSAAINTYSNYRLNSAASGEGDAMLLLASLGDAAYYKSAVEILNASDYKVNYVLNLGDRLVGRSFFSDRNVLVDDELSGGRRPLGFAFPDLEGMVLRRLMPGEEFYAYSQLFRHVFNNYLSSRLLRLKAQIDVALSYFDGKTLSSVVTIPGRAPVSRALTLIASRSALKTVDVQAFFISPMPRYKGSLADSYCAITRDQLDLYVDYHQRERDQRLYRIGSLMMDNQLSAVSGHAPDGLRAEYKIGLDKFVIFFAEQHGDGGYSLEIAKRLISSLSSSMYLIIKIHPRSPVSSVNNLMALVRSYGKTSQVLVTQSGHLYKLIVASDVVVTQFSNVGLEAAVLRKKVLSVLISGDQPVLDFGALGIADVVYSLDEMSVYIDNLTGVKIAEVAPYLLENPELGDGRAGRRVLDISRCVGFYHEGVGAP